VTPADIEWITNTRRVPTGVSCRLSVGKAVSAPEPTERVVFIAHFERGFALPVSDFFRDFLDYYELQPHHLPANAVMTLSAFAAFCEGYAGIEAFIQGWSKYTFNYGNKVLRSPGKRMPLRKLPRRRRTVP
jgi:hypothetical protein